jgi:hypothetical protein
MPVEIRELIIRAVVTGGEEGAEAIPTTAITDEEREAIIEASVRQVLKILKKSQER